MTKNQIVGQRGEELAARYLRRRGYRIVQRNWRCPRGEIDIIARDPADVTALVEVKTRSGPYLGDPLEAITPRKLETMRELAHYWREVVGASWVHIRLDAMGVTLLPDAPPVIRHVRGLG